MNTVFFFGEEHPLSNWHIKTFIVNRIIFNSVEQCVMYCKAKLFKDEETAIKILKARHPREHKRLGRAVKGFVEEIWLERREHFFYRAMLEKFLQNPSLKAYLKNTSDAELVEASPYDREYGIGLRDDDPHIWDRSKWQGNNLCGKLLMRVRLSL